MTNSELKEIFGKRAIQDMCNEKIDELQEDIKKLNNELNEWYEKYANNNAVDITMSDYCKKKDEIFRQEQLEQIIADKKKYYFSDNIYKNKRTILLKLLKRQVYLVEKLLITDAEVEISLIKEFKKYYEKQIDKWERLYRQVADKKKTEAYQQIDVEDIKQKVTFEDLLGKPDWSDNKRARWKCPLHNEKTASFTVYLDQGSYYCYGCHKGGDIINLYQEMNNCDFKTALRELAT